MRSKQRTVTTCALLISASLIGQCGYAAQALDLTHASPTVLRSFFSAEQSLIKKRESVDFNHTSHVRLQQTYHGYPVWGAEAILHLPNGGSNIQSIANELNKPGASLDGTLYQDLNRDLTVEAQKYFSQQNDAMAVNHAIKLYQEARKTKLTIQQHKVERIVFVDDQQKAHWAYKVSFDVPAPALGTLPAKPVYILEAGSLNPFVQWDEIKTHKSKTGDEEVAVDGGGFGGNKKMGKLVYDGLKNNLAKLRMSRDEEAENCNLDNDDVVVKHYRSGVIAHFACKKVDEKHNKVYWNEDLDSVNEGYSPDNDALFGGAVIKDMYQKWYGVSVLTEDGKPMKLVMVVHDPIDNAYWDGRKMTFGDGVSMFYPLTSLGVAAHEISHGFTEQHSDLTYYGQSGGINEAFSDMAAQAAELFAYQKNSWQIGPEIFKAEDEALRYMDKPSKDCNGGKPGDWCSIDSADQYYSGLDVHFSSGVYNRFFYELGTAEGWDAKKAFEVMVVANSNYWTSSTNFKQGACGVLKAAKDLKYDVKPIEAAFEKVAVDTSEC